MHAAGTDEPVMNIEIAKEFINAGTNILLIPVPYTIPHFNEEDFKKISYYVWDYNQNREIDKKVLIMSSIDTTSDKDTIHQIALAAKANCTLLQHIGDAINDISLPENIYTIEVAIKGVKWQTYKMNSSIIRNE